MTATARESLSGVPESVAMLFSPAEVDALLDLRRAIHADPELSFREVRTADRLESALRKIDGVELQRVAGTGIVARIRGTDSRIAPVAVRGDIDALPITEATGLAYASRTAGVMHACGHDVHATWAVAAASLLSRRPARGDVLVVLQPAEEIGAGARAILESGALDGVAAIFGAHVDRRFPVGDVVVDDGALAASSDTFSIAVRSTGSHAARPHETRDVIVAAAALIGSIQTIVSRRLNPATPGVVTVASIRAGEAANVIPESAELRGTVRAVDPTSRALMLDELNRIAAGIGAAYGVGVDVKIEQGTPPVVNAPWPTSAARGAAIRLLGAGHVVPLGTSNLASEDFAFYGERIPACFVRVGAREAGGEFIAAHSPSFHAADASILIGAAILADAARLASGERGAVAG